MNSGTNKKDYTDRIIIMFDNLEKIVCFQKFVCPDSVFFAQGKSCLLRGKTITNIQYITTNV